MQKSKVWLSVVIAGVFIGAVEYWLGWQTLLQPWLGLNRRDVLLALSLMLLSYAVRALRLYDFFHAETRGRFLLALKMTLNHNVLNNFLPMRSGETSFPWLAKRYFQIPPSRSVSVLLWFRLLDLHTLCLFALPALAVWQWGVVAAAGVASAWMLALWGLHTQLNTRMLPWLSQRQHWLGRTACSLLRQFPQQSPHFWRSWAWTVANWATKLAVLAWVFLLFIDVPYIQAMLAVIAGDVTSVLPVHGVAGLGSYEAGVMVGASMTGASAETLMAAAVNLHLFVLGASAAGAAAAYLISHKPRDGHDC